MFDRGDAFKVDAVHTKGEKQLILVIGKDKAIVEAGWVKIFARRFPDAQIEFSLVEFGYQADILITQGDSVVGVSECRDFGGSYELQSMRNWLYKEMGALTEKFRKAEYKAKWKKAKNRHEQKERKI